MDLEVASADNMYIQCGAKAMAMGAITWQAFVRGMNLTGTVSVFLTLHPPPSHTQPVICTLPGALSMPPII